MYSATNISNYGGGGRDAEMDGQDNEALFANELRLFMIKCRQMLGPDSQNYKQFKQICKDSLNYDTPQKLPMVIKMIEEVMKPNIILINDLNRLLPQRYRIEEPVDMTNAVDFINQVKTKAPGIYQSFIDALKQHDRQQITMAEMNQTVQELMRGYPELLEQFKKFLPDLAGGAEQERTQQNLIQQKGKKGVKKQEVEKPQAQVAVKKGAQIRQGPVSTASGPQYGRKQYVEPDDQSQMSESVYNRQQFQAIGHPSSQYNQQLKALPKTEYSFFERLRQSFRDDQIYDEIMKCFYCYVEGVFNQYEFFDLVGGFFKNQSNEDLLNSLKQMVANRDNTRRHHNLLCKPFSEFDISHFKKISYSYYEMPSDFPKPICSGRLDKTMKELCKEVFNDEFSSLPTGSESFKFKTKNQYEEVLFRIEDEMYKSDHDIGNIYTTMKILEEEKLKIEAMPISERDQYKYDRRKFATLREKWIKSTYGECGQQMLGLLQTNPSKAIPIIYDRFKTNYHRALDEKEEQMKLWQEQLEKNFHKSLDHRSFHFKQHEKKNQQPKAYINEIKNIATAPIKNKNINQLRGGSKESEFYCTYSSFEPTCVHSKEMMRTDEIAKDSPINLLDEQHLEKTDILPHMRFLFNDKEMFDLSIQILLAGIRIVNQGAGDKDKMRTSFKSVLEQIFCVQNFQQLRETSQNFVYLTEQQIDIICSKDYYEFKANNDFSFSRFEDIEPVQQAQNQDKNGHDDKGDKDEKLSQEESKYSSPEQAQRQNRPPSMTIQLKPITLQSYQKDSSIVSSTIFMPYFKPEYKLFFGSQQYYIFIKQFYTVYERLIKAKDLIQTKVDEDLKNRQSSEQNAQSNNLDRQYQILSQKSDEIKVERYDVFLSGILSAMNGQLDANKYEDFARSLLGSKSYLLFSFDKLILTTVKQLLNLANDDSCQKSVSVFQKFQNHLEQCQSAGNQQACDHWHNESIYLSNFASQLQEINNFNGVGIRILYSPLSKIVSLHYFQLNPFSLTDKKYYNEINSYTEAQTTEKVSDQGNHYEKQEGITLPTNRIFLIRNKKLMQKVLQNQGTDVSQSVLISNQMIPRLQPQVFKLQFDEQKEDVILRKRKTHLSLEKEYIYNLEIEVRMREVKRRCLEKMNADLQDVDGDKTMKIEDEKQLQQ